MIEKVAFVGAMFSGKTSAAKVLVKEQGFVCLSFADPVKIVAAQMLEQLNAYLMVYDVSSQKWTYDTIQERKGEPQIRKLLQLVGTELGRELYGDTVWIDLLMKNAKNLPRVVVDDARFPNEIEALRSEGFKIVRIMRPHQQQVAMVQERYPDTWQEVMEHPSETAWKDVEFDHIIFAKDLDELRERVVHYVQSDKNDEHR